MTEVYVLWWRHHDGSAAALVRAYFSKARADADMDLLEAYDHSREWHVAAIALVNEAAEKDGAFKLINGPHKHTCIVCHRIFHCRVLIKCFIEDRYAVCDKPKCVAEWERPVREEWCEDSE